MVQTQLSSTRIVSGAGVVATVGSEARNLGMQTVLLLIDPFLAQTPAGQAIAATLSAAGLTVVQSTAVEPDPGEAAIIAGAAVIEVSGGVRYETLRSYALPGVDVISVGALTHSAPAADLSLTILPGRVAAKK
jgi:hypothetical protein